jgi:DNA-binding PadR family transcriptional regulator
MSDTDMSKMAPHAPLKPAIVQILLALAQHDRHGYALMQAVAEQSSGRIVLRTGSLYRHLGTLMDEGLVVEAPRRRQPEDPRRGTDYRLTPRGRAVLEQERRYLAAVVTALDALPGALRKNPA